jgi:hypothetical protein
VGGWLPGMGPNSRTVGPSSWGPLRVIGCSLRSGRHRFRRRERCRLTEALKVLRCNISPITGVSSPDVAMYARWVRTDLVCDIEYWDFVGVLRHPAWTGLRVDLDCEMVHLPA